jgi:hypothetical protein
MRSSPPALRFTIHAVFAGLWVLGAAAFVLKHFFATAGEFGPSPHPWQPVMLLLHGIIAVAATFLFGWICGDHVATTWLMRADRASGIWLLALISVLVVSGFAAFFLVDESLRTKDGSVHELLGLALAIPWLLHLRFGRVRSRLGN